MAEFNIGSQLKNIRAFLGLTQEKFCSEIMSESFYSRVENGKSNISMVALLKLLNHNQVSLYDFFEPIVTSDIKKRVIVDFIDQNVNSLKNLQYNTNFSSNKWQLKFKLMLAIIEHDHDNITSKEIEEFKRLVIRVGKSDVDFLFDLGLLAPFMDYQSLKIIINYVRDSTPTTDTEDFTLRVMSHTFLAFAERCYLEGDLVEAEQTLNKIIELPNISVLFLEKKLANAHLAEIIGNKSKLNEILTLLKQIGYEKYFDYWKKIRR